MSAPDPFHVGATPAPLDPSKVKAGDIVRVLVVTIDSPVYEVSGEAYMLGHAIAVGGHVLTGPGVTLTAHQPAPEPEREWREGVAGTAAVGPKRREVRAYAVGKGAVIEAVGGGYAVWNADDVHDFVPDDDATWRRKYEEVEAALTELAPAPAGVCAHGQTAEDLCNQLPDKVELDAMWTAWKSLTPAEQRGWLEGGEGKAPTPAKVSIRTLMNGGAS